MHRSDESGGRLNGKLPSPTPLLFNCLIRVCLIIIILKRRLTGFELILDRYYY